MATTNGSAPPARLLIADDHDLIRDGMRAMLEDEPDLVIVGEAENGRQAVEVCRKLRPDLVLMDVRMPVMDGLQATRAIKAECPEIVILMVTAQADPEYLLDAVRAGAAGYVLKEATRSHLLDAVRQVLDGESPLNGSLAMRLLRRISEEAARPAPEPDSSHHAKPPEPPSEPLSARELDVLRLLARGRTNRQIGEDLHLSYSTIKTYVARVMAKLNVSDRTQAAVKAIELGLLPEEGEE